MTHIKVVWKDSYKPNTKSYKHKGHTIQGYDTGWIIDVEGDTNIYKSYLAAYHAINKAVGKDADTSKIKIIGQRNETA